MAVTIKTKNLNLKNKLKAAQSKSSRKIKKEIVDLILKSYDKGISPVKGFNKYSQYRPSTAKKKGRKTPVTLKETEQLHESLTAVQKSSSVLSIFFKGSRNSKIASYLHFGTDKMSARPLLPTRGQTFKKGITDKMNKIVKDALKDELK